jgi:ABC-type dipeptide/oligopeptide/nickel transport system ATPase component
VNTPLLSLHVSVAYRGKQPVLRDLALDVQRGEILGLAGHSGSGKSTLALSVLKLLDSKGARATGSAVFGGRDLLALSEREMRQVRGREIALVLQSPASSLNPVLRIGTQLREAWRAHRRDTNGEAEIATALDNVSLPSDRAFLRRYPSEISVGQGQRVLIAMAILHRPQLLIADEPTSALDLITQAEILELFARLNRVFKMAVLLISHDLLAMRDICERVAILHEGQIVECGPTQSVFRNPQHEYARRLVAALPGSMRDEVADSAVAR